MKTPETKPIVRYRGKAVVVRDHAYLTPLDHPNHNPGHDVSNGLNVRTSTVISHDESTGRIETKNTIYMPEKP